MFSLHPSLLLLLLALSLSLSLSLSLFLIFLTFPSSDRFQLTKSHEQEHKACVENWSQRSTVNGQTEKTTLKGQFRCFRMWWLCDDFFFLTFCLEDFFGIHPRARLDVYADQIWPTGHQLKYTNYIINFTCVLQVHTFSTVVNWYCLLIRHQIPLRKSSI